MIVTLRVLCRCKKPFVGNHPLSLVYPWHHACYILHLVTSYTCCALPHCNQENWGIFGWFANPKEPIALLRLFMGWLRRLSITPVRSSTPQRWFRATHMLEKDAAIEPGFELTRFSRSNRTDPASSKKTWGVFFLKKACRFKFFKGIFQGEPWEI